MSAGTGVRHSEFNHAHDRDDALPADLDRAEPSRHRARLRAEALSPTPSKRGRLRLVASPDGRDGSVTIHADASICTPACSTAPRRPTLPLDAGAPRLRARGARRGVGQRPAARRRRRSQARRRSRREARQRPRRRSAGVRPRLIPHSSALNLKEISMFTSLQNPLSLAGRILLALIFITSGWTRSAASTARSATSHRKGCRCRR